MEDIKGGTYGEATAAVIDGFRFFMRQYLPNHAAKARIFTDLGSGEGRSSLLAALRWPQLEHVVGVELSHKRSLIAARALHRLQDHHPKLAERIKLLNASVILILAVLAMADVSWVSNHCFPEDLNAQIGDALDRYAKEGSVVFSSRRLECHSRRAWPLPETCASVLNTSVAFERFASLLSGDARPVRRLPARHAVAAMSEALLHELSPGEVLRLAHGAVGERLLHEVCVSMGPIPGLASLAASCMVLLLRLLQWCTLGAQFHGVLDALTRTGNDPESARLASQPLQQMPHLMLMSLVHRC